MEGSLGRGAASCCYVISQQVPPLISNSSQTNQTELISDHHHHQQQQEEEEEDRDRDNLQSLISFMVPSPLYPPTGNPNSTPNWGTEEVGTTSDPKVDNDARDGPDNCWWKSSVGPEKGKMKVRRKMREPRFCFQTRSDHVDVLDDGYKWRKYGQKIVKNSLHPRSYYRCTQNNCRVKKRIERLSEDCRMVITTYEGRHTHSPSDDTNSSDHEGFASF